jgi:hypothetical protein
MAVGAMFDLISGARLAGARVSIYKSGLCVRPTEADSSPPTSIVVGAVDAANGAGRSSATPTAS